MRRAAVTASLAFAVVVGGFLVIAGIPFATKERDFPASITSPPPLLSVDLDTVPPRERLCMSRIAIEPRSEVARFRIGTYGKTGPPLVVELRGAGYHVTKTIAGGYADNTLQVLAVPSPTRSLLLRVCVKNAGKTKIAFYSANDGHARSRADVTVDGAPVVPTPAFGFWEANPDSFASQVTPTVHRIAVFRGPLGYTWVVWVVLSVAFLGLTLALGVALWRAFRVTGS
jgi:hypothetical protein